MDIKDTIKNKRLENDLTLEEVARAVGVTKATVQRWESGLIANMKRDKIVLLAKALKTTPAYILGIENANYGVNNGIVGNQNNNNVIKVFSKDELPALERAILSVCENLGEKQKGEVLVFASNLLKNKEDK